MLATSEERVLVTHDQDFGDLVSLKRYRAPQGIVLFRYERPSTEEVARVCNRIIAYDLYEFNGHMTVVDEGKVRQRKC